MDPSRGSEEISQYVHALTGLNRRHRLTDKTNGSLQVRRTQRAIKQALTERYYSWDEARKLARDDPEVDLSGENQAYTPGSALEEEYEDDNDHTGEISGEQKILEKASGTAGPSRGGQLYENLPPATEQRQSPPA
jgi:hypothetical protein